MDNNTILAVLVAVCIPVALVLHHFQLVVIIIVAPAWRALANSWFSANLQMFTIVVALLSYD